MKTGSILELADKKYITDVTAINDLIDVESDITVSDLMNTKIIAQVADLSEYDGSSDIKALKFTATGNSTLGITNNSGNTPNLEYSTDGKNWIEWDYSTLTINDGESVYLRGDNSSGISSSYSKYSNFVMTGSLACQGNVMHLLSYTEDITAIPGTSSYCFYKLFSECTALTTAPELPATTLASNCYNGMFSGCTSLTTAPELPATTLADSCYMQMFSGCTSLTTAPELLATSLDANACYGSMFTNCTNLNNITMLATSRSAGYCTTDWVCNVSSTGTFKCASGVVDTVIFRGRDGIPDNWTVVEV